MLNTNDTFPWNVKHITSTPTAIVTETVRVYGRTISRALLNFGSKRPRHGRIMQVRQIAWKDVTPQESNATA